MVDGTTPGKITVSYDGDQNATVVGPVYSMVGPIPTNTRVYIDVVPPAGAYISGFVGTPPETQISVRVRRSANQSIPTGVTTDISWDTEDTDVYGFITAPSTSVTVPAGADGMYVCTLAIIGSGLTAVARHVGTLALLGTLPTGVPTGFRQDIDLDEDRMYATAVIPLVEGSILRGQILQNQGSAINVTAWLNAVRIGPYV